MTLEASRWGGVAAAWHPGWGGVAAAWHLEAHNPEALAGHAQPYHFEEAQGSPCGTHTREAPRVSEEREMSPAPVNDMTGLRPGLPSCGFSQFLARRNCQR